MAIPVVPEALSDLAETFHLWEIARATAKAFILFPAMFVVIYVLEAREGADKTRYTSRNFFNDVVYTLFYRGGFYQVFIMAAVASALEPRLAMFKFDLLALLPAVVAYVLFWLVLDFLGYWLHRLQHGSRFLWAFHSVHHSQERLTFLTSYRNHVLDQLISNVVIFTPLLMLGLPPKAWLPLYLIQNMHEAIQHSELNWRFGRLYRWIVSPVFHAFHHSRSALQYNGNYGKILSIWDFMFGTAVDQPDRPKAYGIEGTETSESLWRQLIAPFQILYRTYITRTERSGPIRP